MRLPDCAEVTIKCAKCRDMTMCGTSYIVSRDIREAVGVVVRWAGVSSHTRDVNRQIPTHRHTQGRTVINSRNIGLTSGRP